MGQCLCKEKLKCRKASKNAANVSNGSGPAMGVQDTPNINNEGNPNVSRAGGSNSTGRRNSSSGSESLNGDDSSGNLLRRRRREKQEKKAEDIVDSHVKKMLSIIRELVDNNDSPPVTMRSLHKRAEQEDGWIAIVNSMIRVIPVSDPLGPAVMLLLLDECPLPTKSSVAEFLRNWPLTKRASHLGMEDPQTHRNLCVILSCLAEKLAGSASTSLLLHHNGAHNDYVGQGDFSDEIPELDHSILGYLLENVSVTRDPNVVLFSLIALEKFAQTSKSKKLIIKALSGLKPNPLSILELWREDSVSAKRQVGFLAQWYLDNLFVPEERKFTYLQIDYGSTKALLNAKDVSEYLKISADGLEARCDASSFESVRCTHPVDKGIWYYEVEVVTAGVMQIGWATKLSKFLNHEGYGIGDDDTSLAYDGCRQVTWFSATSSPHSHPEWKSGDILGCLLSLEPETRHAAFFLNGKSLPSRDVPSLNRLFFHLESQFGATSAFPSFFAAASFMSFQQCIFNFGKEPFRFPPAVEFCCFNDVGTMLPDNAAILPRQVVLAKLMAGSENGVSEDACTLCCDERASVTLLPCRHTGFCRECADQMNTCPLCRSAIASRRGASQEGSGEDGDCFGTGDDDVDDDMYHGDVCGNGIDDQGLEISRSSRSGPKPADYRAEDEGRQKHLPDVARIGILPDDPDQPTGSSDREEIQELNDQISR